MAATSSPSPLELFQSRGIERLEGSNSAGLLFRRSPNASQMTAATGSSASLPCSPAHSPSSASSTLGDLRQSTMPPSTTSFQAAAAAFALSLALGGRQAASRQPAASAFGPPPLPSPHQLIFNGGRHGGLPSPTTGINCAPTAAGSQHLPRHQPLEASAFYVPPVSRETWADSYIKSTLTSVIKGTIWKSTFYFTCMEWNFWNIFLTLIISSFDAFPEQEIPHCSCLALQHLLSNDVTSPMTSPADNWNNLYNSTAMRNMPTAYDPRVAAEFQPYLHWSVYGSEIFFLTCSICPSVGFYN